MRVLAASVCLAMLASAAGASQPAGIALREGLAIPSVGRYGRTPVHTDAIEALLVAGRWKAPRAGDTVALPGGAARTWQPVTADKDGWFSGPALEGGYVFIPVESAERRVMVLEAAGQSVTYLNGEPRAGDPYATGYVRLPVELKAGRNELLFQVGRGRLRAKLAPPKAEAFLNVDDATLPDLVVGQPVRTQAAVVVANATAGMLTRAQVTATIPGGRGASQILTIVPLGVRKAGIRMEGPAPKEAGTMAVRLALTVPDRRGRKVVDEATINLRVRKPTETRKVTFASDIDESVQYYAVNPAQPVPGYRPEYWVGGGSGYNMRGPALVLSLHGAGVEAIGQADAYEGKSWANIVCPTNRRPYGFDWEDWGRLDAMEVLEKAQWELRTDPWRVYLTGHSMGGHGTWIVGATFPDRFAAIGPSAGWISFRSYAGGAAFDNPSPVEVILRRAASPTDTLGLLRNYAQEGVYILHGDADDNVPVTEARTMRQKLTEAGIPFSWHEQKGAGHWWDASDEPGADCVDWAPMFDLFAHRLLPSGETVRQVDFVTMNPAVSARCHWVTVEAQEHSLRPSTVSIRWDPGQRRLAGATTNVARLSLGLSHVAPNAPLRVELDGGKLEGVPWPTGFVQGERRLWLAREGGAWKVVPEPSPALKGPERCGPFKEAFRNRMVFVYGTEGTPDENAWALARARYDAETWWVRGNGSVELIPDASFAGVSYPDRNVVVYGNADTNAAWKGLLGSSPIQVTRGSVRVGGREAAGSDLACLFVRPRPDSPLGSTGRAASVAVVCGTGLAGMRLTDRLPYFTSGVEYPDWIVLGPGVLARGAAGVQGAGFFGPDWSVESGDSAWASP